MMKAVPKAKEFICKCFYSRNIFLQKYKLHVTYESEDQFEQEFRQELRMRGCASTEQYKAVLTEIEKEISRRKNFHHNAFERYQVVSDTYQPLHSHLWDFKPSFMDDRLPKIVDSILHTSSIEDVERAIIHNGGNVLGAHLYRIPFFSNNLCKQLVEELSHFEDSPCPKGRPNTMSNHGISLDEMGLSDSLLTPIITRYIQPLSTALFDHWCPERLDSFRAFSVHYGPGKDTELSMHYDNAEVTLNVCLTSEFEGGHLEYGGLWGDPSTESYTETVMHQLGSGILHLGQHTHRALPMESGSRCNLVMWMRSSAIRNNFCRMCGSKPDVLEVPFAGDGFTQPSGDPGHCVAI